MKKIILSALALCLLLTACGQTVPQVNLNTTHPTTAPTSKSTTVATTAPTTQPPTTAPTTKLTTTPTTPTTRPTFETMTIEVRGRERYELMKAAATDDAALEAFVATERHPWLKERENIVSFLKLLDSIPVFSVENAKYFSIGYERAYEMLYVVYRLTEEPEVHNYRFDYALNKKQNTEYKEKIIQEVGTKEFAKIGKEQKITLLKADDMSGSNNAKTRAYYEIEAEGMYIAVSYKNINTDVSLLKPEEVFAPIKLEETFDTAVSESLKSTEVQ